MKKVLLIGNLTEDVTIEKVNVTKEGKKEPISLAKISLACNEKDKTKEPTYINDIAVWGVLAENLAKYNKKGSKLYIEADITNNNYTDKEGVKHYSYNYTAIDIEYLSSKEKEG